MTANSMLMRRSTLLAAAFAALLTVTGGAALAIRHGAANAAREVAALNSAHLAAGNALASIRGDIFLSGILTRDYLLDSDPSHATGDILQFEAIRDATNRNFQILAASASALGENDQERAAISRLHSQIDAYWTPTRAVLDWTPAQKRENTARFLQARRGYREEILRLASQTEQLMSSNFSRERTRITSANEKFGLSLEWITGLSLLLGACIAAAAVARMMALEHQSERAEAGLLALSAELRMAQEQERRSLSRELHDQAGQMLTGLRMELASISWSAGEAEFSERLDHARGIVEQCLRVVRNIAMLLRPSMLDDLGISAALGWLVRDLTRSSGIEIQAELDPALDDLPDAHRTCVYRLVQEALTNAVRHSGARNVEISVTAADGVVTGVVADDGSGFSGSPQKGLGLVGLQERVRELGGSARIISSPERGTRVEFRLPQPSPVPLAGAAL